jgi:hypothetical protein
MSRHREFLQLAFNLVVAIVAAIHKYQIQFQEFTRTMNNFRFLIRRSELEYMPASISAKHDKFVRKNIFYLF